MSPTWFERLSQGLTRTREQLGDRIAELVGRGPDVGDDFWEGLEETLIAADMGAAASLEIVERLRTRARREDLPDAAAVEAALVELIAAELPVAADPLAESPVTVLFVGVNGTGKTTSVGKIAAEQAALGRKVVVGSADTYRAAAIEQLRVWADRAGVPIVERDRGADPASVVFDTLAEARETGADLVLVDTAGRLHTSVDLMQELQKVQRVAKAQSTAPVRSLLVIDATTGQNGLVQARAFNDALDLDGIVLTKLDGTARGGIAVAAARELGLPIVRIGVGEALEDLHAFDPTEFARALTGV
ncbi:MAG: signal recognition particle-docking protein FtsY [Coriobacteriia bacterium]|nr:signal recognition particle-docking protein FtsY [Coriobacteriia bacterium]